MILSRFGEDYFSFILSGRAEDFAQAANTFQEALGLGHTLPQIQERMDESHASAEVLCLILDNGAVKQG